MNHLHFVEAVEFGGGKCGRQCAIVHMVPALGPQRGGVAATALHLVRQRDRGHDVAALRADQLADGEGGGDVVAGVGGFFAEIGVVEVEIADQRPVGERRKVGGRAVLRAEQPRAVCDRHVLCDGPRDLAGPALPRAQRATDRIQNSPIHLVNDRTAEGLELRRLRPGGQLCCQRHVVSLKFAERGQYGAKVAAIQRGGGNFRTPSASARGRREKVKK